MTDRRRNSLILLDRRRPDRGVAGRDRHEDDAPRPGPEGRRRARLPGQADGPVEGGHRIARTRDQHHAQARRPARRRPAGNPALGRRRNRRGAARRQQRLARPGRGGQDRPAVLLRLGAERDRPDRQARAERRHGHGRRHQRGRRRGHRGADRVPGRAARRQTAADPAQHRHDLDAGVHARSRSTAASTAAGTCSTPCTKRPSAPGQADLRSGRNRTEPLRGQLQAAGRRQGQGGAGQPRDRGRAGSAGRIGGRQDHPAHRRTAGTCSTTNRS